MPGLGNLGGGLPNSFDHSAYQTPESGPHVVEVVESSRSKAQKMVDVAVQVSKANKLFFVMSCSALCRYPAILTKLYRDEDYNLSVSFNFL